MRPPVLVWLLLACACNTSNPVFGVLTEAGAETTDATASTTDTPPTTSAATVPTTTNASSLPSGMGEVTDPTVPPDTGMAEATSEPPGTSTESTRGSESGDPEWVCDPEIHGFAQNVPRDLLTLEDWQGCDKDQQPYETLVGRGAMTAMGALHFAPGPCQIMEDNFLVELGRGYPAPEQNFCGKFNIVWDPGPGCKIAAFTFEEFNLQNEPLGHLYGLYHSPAMIPPGLPYTPTLAPDGSCGCPNIVDQCCPSEPGQHALLVQGQAVEPGTTAVIGDLQFTNWNGHIYPECIEDPMKPPRIDWFGVRL